MVRGRLGGGGGGGEQGGMRVGRRKAQYLWRTEMEANYKLQNAGPFICISLNFNGSFCFYRLCSKKRSEICKHV